MRTERERTATAYHEAGDAVMHIYLGDEFEYATVKPDGGSLGRVQPNAQDVADGWFGEDRESRKYGDTEAMELMPGAQAAKAEMNP